MLKKSVNMTDVFWNTVYRRVRNLKLVLSFISGFFSCSTENMCNKNICNTMSALFLYISILEDIKNMEKKYQRKEDEI